MRAIKSDVRTEHLCFDVDFATMPPPQRPCLYGLSTSRKSGLQVPVLCLGTPTFGGETSFQARGNTDVNEATRLIDILHGSKR
jgi:hypothetical protein